MQTLFQIVGKIKSLLGFNRGRKGIQKMDNINKNNQQLSNQISITSYNILADLYTDPWYFPYCPKQYLNFDYRKWKIVEEIKLINSDIVCLQEADHIEDFYYQQFQDLGYQIQYALKPYRAEGILVMFKKDKFKMISEHVINFDNEIPDTFNKANYQRNNNALIIQLKHLISDLNIVIANTHLFWNPQNEEVKLLQTAQILQHLTKNYKQDENIILCGDFNSMPTSNVIKYITDKKEPHLSRVEKQFAKYVLIKDMMAIHNMFSEMNLIDLKSSYDDYLKTGKHPEFTNYTQNFKGTLDYILFNPNMKQFQLSEVREIPIDLIKKQKGLPSQDYPSDHLPITAIFSINQDGQDQKQNSEYINDQNQDDNNNNLPPTQEKQV
ncbi:endonuclease/exonuclease/phosphatase family protein (macronuclear) [Tetrahymena thermophila SB210]|uniref:Endonuclease/exonuclease/phosphatase family protein n=1 Tax=Tetrahymena thermophila (strain SB210) TaxID=312017 RepID=Q24DC8_TETTS|nr:endonuclease/exonuclease/phosphatase family protein [Tetrahymena thermophila SB210]EAS05777.2 endonuclease/exonuclease/phosphatase family protein [Tetrahymena thermophila SB210]|eukprot:XP_001026022.2 endonuclease/exonuclease/phosphatase family protein [Tetrahymena thermophila SB210]